MKRKNRPQQAIEISSLIDLIFILLLFFVITTTFHKSKIDLTLPETSQSTSVKQEKTIDIYIDKKGQSYINNTAYSLAKVSTFISNSKNKNIVIYPDKNTKTQHLISLMEILKNANIDTISIATEKK